MSSSPIPFLDSYESLDVIGNGSFGIIRKVRRKSDGLVSVPVPFACYGSIKRPYKLFARKELNFERMTERDRKQIVAEVCVFYHLCLSHVLTCHAQKYSQRLTPRPYRPVPRPIRRPGRWDSLYSHGILWGWRPGHRNQARHPKWAAHC